MRRIVSCTGRVALWFWMGSFAGTTAQVGDGHKSLSQLREEAAKASETQPATSESTLTLTFAAPQPASCPAQTALALFRHEIAYDRTEELDPLRGLRLIHVRVWQRGSATAFYVEDATQSFPPNVRLVYSVGAAGTLGYATCPSSEDWQKCVAKSAGPEGSDYLARTCTTLVDLRAIPAWAPSPDDQTKRKVAEELRHEIEEEWQGAREIVVRDFNLQDRQITIYLRLSDGDYFQGCSFHAVREPHCEGWHLFGQVPASSIRKWIFDRPYRLK
jgi:hypothetical protein